MAHRHSIQKELLTEKPKSAAAVMPTLMAVTLPAPSFRVSRSLCRLEITVPMEGHADPSRESGRPRLINEI